MRRALAVAGLLILAAPTASAYAVDMVFPTERLPPGLGPVDGTLTVTVDCQEAWERNPPITASTLVVTVTHDSPPDIKISGSGRLVVDTTPCIQDPTGQVTTTETYGFAALRDSAGFIPHTVSLTAELEGGQFGDPISNTTSGSVTVGYYGAMSLKVPEPAVTVTPGESATFTFELTNFGNAPSVASLRSDAALPAGWSIALPADILIGSKAHGQENQATATVTVQTPEDALGWTNNMLAVDITVDYWADDDPTEEGNPLFSSLVVRDRGVKGAPAPTPLLALAVLGGAAFLARRRP